MEPRSDPERIHDARLERLEQWLGSVLGFHDFDVVPASVDASFRRYFRVSHGDRTWVAMDAPPDKEDVGPYIEVAGMLAAAGVNAPRVLECNLADGYLLLTDLGSTTYLTELARGNRVQELYADAISALVAIQANGRGHAPGLPPYDDALLRREMALFPEWFLGRHLQLPLVADEVRMLSDVFDRLSREALAQPRVFVHRDYHSRNLMVCDLDRHGPNPGILDFQDAVFGPVSYDLVSLLRDCYVAWPGPMVVGWVDEFRRQAAAVDLDVGRNEAQFLRWFDLMGVQRHLKAIGIFARLYHRDGKPGYLRDIPRTLNYVFEVSSAYPELGSLGAFIEQRVLPALARVEAPGTA